MAKWSITDIPDQSGRTIVVTGASSGIGEEAAMVLAGKGAEVVLAVRDARRGEATRAKILARHPQARASVSLADMADLASIRAFAERTSEAYPHIDVLLNNAGLGMQPVRATTADGFERQFGTNHLGHFALTGLLLPALMRAPSARVVTISSIAHQRAKIAFDDLQGERRYKGGEAYSQSKLANLIFALELDRRARAKAPALSSVAAHPGVATTGFLAATQMSGPLVTLGNLAIGVFGQNAAPGALPGLYAATMPDVRGGDYWGPDGILEIRGTPKRAYVAPQARDREAGRRLWAMSEDLTGVRYEALG